MRLIVLLFFAEIFCQVAEYRCRIRRSSFKRRDAARTAPSIAAFDPYDDVLVEKAALFQKAYGRLRRELVGAEFADADEVAKSFSLFRFSHLEERVETVNLTARRRFADFRKGFDLRPDKFAQSTIFKAFND